MHIPDSVDGMGNLTDEELSLCVRKGDESAFNELTHRYLFLIQAKASTYYKMGLEQDDLLQEGTLGLLNAARAYDAAGGASFKTYAGICIERRLLTAYRTAARQKNLPLNTFLSLSDMLDNQDIEAQLASDFLINPEDLVIHREDFKQVKQRIEESLSSFELEVLSLYLTGRTYEEIAQKLNVTAKAVDNALQRIRKKLKESFS